MVGMIQKTRVETTVPIRKIMMILMHIARSDFDSSRKTEILATTM